MAEQDDSAGTNILDRLGAALDRSRPEQLDSRALLAKKKASLHSLSPVASPQHVSVDGLQQRSPSPLPVVAPFNLAAHEGWTSQGGFDVSTQPAQLLREPSPDLRSHLDPRHASLDVTPNRSCAADSSPKSLHKSIHAIRAEAHRESLTPGTLAAQTQILVPGADSAVPGSHDTPPCLNPWYPQDDDAHHQTQRIQRPARAKDRSSSNTPRNGTPPAQLIIDEIPATEMQQMQQIDEVTMETLILAENQAVQHVVVAGCGRKYLACIVTLKVERDSRLAPESLEFAAASGSDAVTVHDAKTCSAFHTAMLKGFAACNKKIWEASRRSAFSHVNRKPAQLRRYTILPELFSPIDQTLRPDGTVDRSRVLDIYAEVIESMYGAANTGTEDAVCVTPMHPSIGGRIESSLSTSSGAEWPVQDMFGAKDDGLSSSQSGAKAPRPVDYPTDSNYNESGSTGSTLDAQAVASGVQNGKIDIHGDENFSPGEQHAASACDTNFQDSQFSLPTDTLPKIERASAPVVLAHEPTPNFAARMCSYLKTFVPCLGPHSQALDDDILNPGHTIVKRPEPGRRSNPSKKLANKVATATAKTFEKGVFDASTDAVDVMPISAMPPDVYSTGGPPFNSAPLSFRTDVPMQSQSGLNMDISQNHIPGHGGYSMRPSLLHSAQVHWNAGGTSNTRDGGPFRNGFASPGTGLAHKQDDYNSFGNMHYDVSGQPHASHASHQMIGMVRNSYASHPSSRQADF